MQSATFVRIEIINSIDYTSHPSRTLQTTYSYQYFYYFVWEKEKDKNKRDPYYPTQSVVRLLLLLLLLSEKLWLSLGNY